MFPADVNDKTMDEFLKAAAVAARRVSSDPQVVEEAADHAVVQLGEYWDRVSTGDLERRSWLQVVAANHAKKVGAKLHRDLPMGRAGSEPPPMHDDKLDMRVAELIGDIHLDGGSLGSLVAMRVDFQRRWALLSGETRSLLSAKYAEGMSSKAIAEERNQGEAAGTIDDRLKVARKAARMVLEDLLDQSLGSINEGGHD